MKVGLKQVDKVNFVAVTDSGHEISMDGASDIGGANRGARPMEVVLSGLGGCSAIDVMLILEKSRQAVDNCEIEITAERADSIPKVFTKIHIRYIVHGTDLDAKKVGRAVKLSLEKYCSVTRMLEKTAEITADFEIGGE